MELPEKLKDLKVMVSISTIKSSLVTIKNLIKGVFSNSKGVIKRG